MSAVAVQNPVSGTFEPYERVDVVSDTAAWEEERRRTLGASDVPAVLGLSPYATQLDVYRAKHGVDRPMDPELAFIGHAEEVVIGKWMRAFRPELGVVRRGFMARSLAAPWLHASFDRFLVKRSQWTPVQMKTAHQYAGADWEDEQVPLAVQAQVQTELLVFGAQRGYAVAFVGGRRFHLQPIERDEDFIRDLLIPQTRRFWEEHVLAQVPPDPTTSAEAVSIWPGDDEIPPLVADAELEDLVARLRSLQGIAAGAERRVDETKLEIQKRMGQATELVDPMGETLVTWKPTKGARRLDVKALRGDLPDIAATYTPAPTPGRTFRLPKTKGDDA